MNIVIFGAGTPDKFGYDFVQKSRQEGHRVTVFSHKDHGISHVDHYVIDYNNLNNCEFVFNTFLENNKDKIDILIYNTLGGNYPTLEYFGYNTPDLSLYQHTFNTHFVVPHLFIAKSIHRMNENAKTIFFASTLGLNFNDSRKGTEQMVGYASGNIWKVNMMLGYANNRKKNITYCCISPSIQYKTIEGFKRYKEQDFELLYNFIYNCDDSYTGKLIAIWGDNKILTVNTVFNVYE